MASCRPSSIVASVVEAEVRSCLVSFTHCSCLKLCNPLTQLDPQHLIYFKALIDPGSTPSPSPYQVCAFVPICSVSEPRAPRSTGGTPTLLKLQQHPLYPLLLKHIDFARAIKLPRGSLDNSRRPKVDSRLLAFIHEHTDLQATCTAQSHVLKEAQHARTWSLRRRRTPQQNAATEGLTTQTTMTQAQPLKHEYYQFL